MEGQYDGIYDVLLRNTVSYTWYCSICIAVFLFIMAGARKIRNKNLSFVLIGLGINILASPVALL